MLSLQRLILNNLPNAKPELWANLPAVMWRRVSAWANTKLDPNWPNQPLLARIGSGGLLLEVIPSDVIGAPIALFGIYEYAVTHLLRKYLGPGDVFVDVGANVGYYSVLAAGAVGGGGRVFAFEPNPRVRARLERNVALNAMAGVVEVRPEAASVTDGMVHLVEPNDPTNAGLAFVDTRADARGIEVQAVRLDGVPELLPRPPSLLKVDVEGGESDVFRGASGMLESPEGPSILFESFDLARDSAALRDLGYQIYQPVLRRGAVRLSRDLSLARYRSWEAPNFLAVKGARGLGFAHALEER
jgi:FkbM family methyltransferase